MALDVATGEVAGRVFEEPEERSSRAIFPAQPAWPRRRLIPRGWASSPCGKRPFPCGWASCPSGKRPNPPRTRFVLARGTPRSAPDPPRSVGGGRRSRHENDPSPPGWLPSRPDGVVPPALRTPGRAVVRRRTAPKHGSHHRRTTRGSRATSRFAPRTTGTMPPPPRPPRRRRPTGRAADPVRALRTP